MELWQELTQSQILSNQQIQSLEILSMGSQDLVDYINQALLDNPALEAQEMHPAEIENPLNKLKWLEAEDNQNRYYIRRDVEDQRDPLLNVAQPESAESLVSYVLYQLRSLSLPPAKMQTARFVAESLDKNGYLDETDEELASSLSLPLPLVQEAVETIQGLDPIGIGARTLSDCLTLQLKAMTQDTALAEEIVQNHLEQLGKKRYAVIAKSMGLKKEDVFAAEKQIRALNPKPGAAFDQGTALPYIRPDVTIVRFKDYFEVLSSDYYVPRLYLSQEYKQMLNNNPESEVEKYLSDRFRNAKWLINCISQRRSTLVKCAETILDFQLSFFLGEQSTVNPLSMAQVAEKMDVNISTVSRTVRDKYLQCSRGIFPMSYFFARKLGDDQGISSDKARHLLTEIIKNENNASPLSDRAIAEQMCEKGVTISRRTVAKYRGEMNIPDAYGRKAE